MHVCSMAMVGWVGSGMEVVDGMHASLSWWVGLILGDTRALPDAGDTLMTPPSHRLPGAQLLVGSNRNWLVFFGMP